MNDPLVAEQTAPLSRRALAHAADLATVGTWLWALSISQIAFWLRWSDDRAVAPWGQWFLAALTFSVLFVVYHTAFVAKVGATPGQDLLRIREVDRATGGRPRFGNALVRAAILGGVWMLPWWWPGILCTLAIGISGARDPEGRMLHDHLAGTAVVVRLVPELKEGQTVEEAEAERRRQFSPSLVNPLQITPMQMFRHPHLRRHRGGAEDDDG